MRTAIRIFLFAALGLARSLGQEVALTFDDLPSHGPLPPGVTRLDVARSVIRTLREANAPRVYGFLNAKKLQEVPRDAEVLKLWTAAGFPLGNHTWSHMDLHNNSAEAFEKDVKTNEPALVQYRPAGDWQWFRYPYLHEGDTSAKRQRVADYLMHQGYRVAEVTLDFDDYAFNAPYARCAARHDTPAIEGLKASYLEAAEESLRIGQEMARAIWGRDVKHVMLLHIGAFEMVMLPRLMELLKARGFKLITLEDAESDEAYRTVPALSSHWDGTLLEQMARAKRLKWPRGAFSVAELDTVCR